MRLSIPGFKGLYFDTEAESSTVTLALTAAGRRAPKPQGYAVQLLPYLWSFDVDLREVPNDHPIQYLHPEGAQSLRELPADRSVRQVGGELERVLQFVWAVNETVESGAGKLVGREGDHEGITIEITEGTVGVDGTNLETDEFDIDEDESRETAIDIEDGPVDELIDETEPNADGVDDPATDEFDDTDDIDPDEP